MKNNDGSNIMEFINVKKMCIRLIRIEEDSSLYPSDTEESNLLLYNENEYSNSNEKLYSELNQTILQLTNKDDIFSTYSKNLIISFPDNELFLTPSTVQYECIYCDEILSSEQELEKHLDFHNVLKYHQHALLSITETNLKSNFNEKADSNTETIEQIFSENINKEFRSINTTNLSFQENLAQNICINNKKQYRCSCCKILFSKLIYLRIHLQYCIISKYKCLFCQKLLSQRKHIQIHLINHLNKKLYKRSIYFKLYVSKQNNTNYYSYFINKKPFKCIYCSKYFLQLNYLKRHLLSHNNNSSKLYKNQYQIKVSLSQKNLICYMSSYIKNKLFKSTIYKKCFSQNSFKIYKFCNRRVKCYKYTRSKKLLFHSKYQKDNLSHSIREKLYKCIYCVKSFSYKKNFNIHLKSHINKKCYKCTYCNKFFSYSNKLKIHLRSHTGEKPYKCTYCDKYFTLNSNLKIHLRIHTGEKPYKCTYCDKYFTLNSNLKIHLRIHTGEKLYKCTYCDKYFTLNSNLKIHLRIHTGEKPYKCTYCDKYFTLNSSLKIHLRIHTGEKPYKCTYCNKFFSQSNHLKMHLRTHTGEKPYKCTYCNKFFSRFDYLKIHLQSHTGEKPYKCTYCDKSFSKYDLLKIHLYCHIKEKLN